MKASEKIKGAAADLGQRFKDAFSREGVKRAFTKENVAKAAFAVFAAFSILAVLLIVFYLLFISVGVFRDVGFFKMLFGDIWNANNEEFGILPMIVGTLVLTLCSTLIGGTIAVFIAIFMAYYCPKKIKGIYSQIINLLAGIPSIVYGFFGLVVIVPAIESIFQVPRGSGLLSGTLILSIMIIPTVASVARNSLEAVPSNYYEGALALGCSKNQAVFKVCVPAAQKGIIAALILGVGRAVGETMAVQAVIGNSTNFYPTGLFQGFKTLTSHIVQTWGYATDKVRDVLVACGFVLLVIILILNAIILLVQRGGPGGNKYFTRRVKGEADSVKSTLSYKKTGSAQDILWIISYVLAIVVAAVMVAIVVFILIRGVGHLDIDFLFGESRNGHTTLAPAFVSTGMLIVLALVIALPFGIGAAVYLNEYAKKRSIFVKAVRLFVDTLAGIPSIIFGLFGYVFLVSIMGGYNLLAGGIVLALMILPTVIRSVEQSLSEVPDSMREASLALGASKVRTIFLVVLPSALAGIVTSIILSIGRIVSESAALIFTAGSVTIMPSGFLDPGASFAVYMYRFMSEGTSLNECYATAVVLLIFVIILNLLVTLVERLGDKNKGRPHPILAIKSLFVKKREPQTEEEQQSEHTKGRAEAGEAL